MCHFPKPIEHFKSHPTRKDGLQSQCTDCQREYRREHYLRNRRKYIDKAAVIRRGVFEWWREYKTQFVCKNCGENHPACIQFHHPNKNKDMDVARLIGSASRERVIKEIAKCVPLCANCHAKEHWKY